MKKIILKIVAVVLVIAGWFFLIQIETPCEANPKMVLNGYCDTGAAKRQEGE